MPMAQGKETKTLAQALERWGPAGGEAKHRKPLGVLLLKLDYKTVRTAPDFWYPPEGVECLDGAGPMCEDVHNRYPKNYPFTINTMFKLEEFLKSESLGPYSVALVGWLLEHPSFVMDEQSDAK